MRRVEVGGMTWTFTEMYGWVNDEDDAAMLTEAAMLDEIERLRNPPCRGFCDTEGAPHWHQP